MGAVALAKQDLRTSRIRLGGRCSCSSSLGVAIRASGVRPYGERQLGQIDRQWGLCVKFGLPPGTSQFADCMIALADLRQRHVDLLTSYSWL